MQAITASQTVFCASAKAAAPRNLSARRATPKALVATRPATTVSAKGLGRGVSLVVRAEKPNMDSTTGYIGADNSGKGNIFAIEPKTLYTESPTSDKYAKVGIGGVPGIILVIGFLAGVYFSTQTLGQFEDASQEFINFQGQPLTYYIDAFTK